MARGRFKSLPVVDDEERVVGVISRSDVIRTRARVDLDVAHDLAAVLDDPGHRDLHVEVHEGVVRITGPDSVLDRSTAELPGNTVAGVVEVQVS